MDVCVADPCPEARSHATNAGIREIASDLSQLSETDGIVIATPTVTHAHLIDGALERQASVFVEKPITAHASQAKLLAERAPGRLFVMDKWRYHPGIEELPRIRASGELGKPLGMHLRHAGWGNPHNDGDVIWILLPHCFSIFLEVFGELPQPRYAVAELLDGGVAGLNGVFGTNPGPRSKYPPGAL